MLPSASRRRRTPPAAAAAAPRSSTCQDTVAFAGSSSRQVKVTFAPGRASSASLGSPGGASGTQALQGH